MGLLRRRHLRDALVLVIEARRQLTFWCNDRMAPLGDLLRRREHPIEYAPDLVVDRRSDGANRAIDIQQPLAEALEHASECMRWRAAFHDVGFEAAGELLMGAGGPVQFSAFEIANIEVGAAFHAEPIKDGARVAFEVLGRMLVLGEFQCLVEKMMAAPLMDDRRGVCVPHQRDHIAEIFRGPAPFAANDAGFGALGALEKCKALLGRDFVEFVGNREGVNGFCLRPRLA